MIIVNLNWCNIIAIRYLISLTPKSEPGFFFLSKAGNGKTDKVFIRICTVAQAMAAIVARLPIASQLLPYSGVIRELSLLGSGSKTGLFSYNAYIKYTN